MVAAVSSIPPLSPSSSSDELSVVFLKGAEIEPFLLDIVDLHLEVFKETPYSYEGNREEYIPCIKAYADSKEGVACLLFDGKKLIGAATGCPLLEMPEKWLEPLRSQKNLERTFYLGEEVILEKYRGKHLGSLLSRRFVQAISPFYDRIVFARIEEKVDSALNEVLKKRGFEEKKDLSVDISWRDIESKEVIPHKLIYWFTADWLQRKGIGNA